MYRKLIYKKEYTSKTSKWGEQVPSYVEIYRIFDFKEGLRYVAKTPNFSCCRKGKVDALLRVLEHESIKARKYERLKDIIYSKKLWNKIC